MLIQAGGGLDVIAPDQVAPLVKCLIAALSGCESPSNIVYMASLSVRLVSHVLPNVVVCVVVDRARVVSSHQTLSKHEHPMHSHSYEQDVKNYRAARIFLLLHQHAWNTSLQCSQKVVWIQSLRFQSFKKNLKTFLFHHHDSL